MVETGEMDVDIRQEGVEVCCPRCKSKDVILRESKEGYFWIYLCNNCGYKGKEGNSIGCIDKSNEPTHVREEE